MQFTLGDLWAHMSTFPRLIVIAMALMSIGSLLIVAERFVVFLRSSGDSKIFAQEMGTVLAAGDLQKALESHPDKQGHLGRVIEAGLKALRNADPKNRELAVESVARALERQASREVAGFKRGLGVLATVGSTAPFVGLLGTVMGIVNAFQSMAASGSGGLGTVSAGIAEALVTTAFGLLAAIPAVMFYNYFQGWVDGRTVDITESANEFLDLVSRKLAS